MDWTSQQNEALTAINRWVNGGGPQVFRLFGYAGTGKTTIAHETQNMVGRVLYASFTGKAALVMKRKGCKNAKTIHSMIYLPDEEASRLARDDDGPIFILNRDSEAASADLIVIDECSMVDAEVGKDLLSFGVKVLVIGDPGQLPPVEGVGFFTNATPDYMLTEIHRQGKDDPIIHLSFLARTGRPINPGMYGKSAVLDRREITDDHLMSADQVLCGTHVTRKGVNAKMRKLKFLADLDGRSPPLLPLVGDRLVCLRNNRKKGLLNGGLWDVVKIKGARRRDREVTRAVVEAAEGQEGTRQIAVANAFFEGDEAAIKAIPWPKRKSLDEFDFGYALTCHKSQGSQWDDVLVLNQAHVFREDRDRWLYTAITRAAERVTIVHPARDGR